MLRDHSRRTRRFAKLMRTQLRQFGKAVHGGRLPAGLAGLPDGSKRPKHAPVRSFPPPSPGPPAQPAPAPAPTPPPAVTTLTLACPSSVVAPKPIEISGDLSPAVAGATIHVSYSSAETGRTNHDTSTDVNGGYKDRPASTTGGTYTVQASWDGDGAHKPASSPICTVEVGS